MLFLFFQEKSISGLVAGTCGVVQLQKGALRLSHLLPCRFGYDFDVFGKPTIFCNLLFLYDSADFRYVFF